MCLGCVRLAPGAPHLQIAAPDTIGRDAVSCAFSDWRCCHAARAADAGSLVNAATVYASTITYRDVTGGGNGASCLAGYNLCAGRRSWIGTTP
jgi:hypothetical protein